MYDINFIQWLKLRMSLLKCMKGGVKLIITNVLHKNRNESEISNTRAGDLFLHLPAIQCLIKIRN